MRPSDPQLVGETADIQWTVNRAAALDHREAAAGETREASLSDDQPRADEVHERELTQVEHDVLEPRAVKLVQMRLQCADGRYVKFTARRDTDDVSLRMNVDPKRRVMLRNAVDDGCASS